MALSVCFCIFSLHITEPGLCKSKESLKVRLLRVSSAALSVRSEVNPLSGFAAMTTSPNDAYLTQSLTLKGKYFAKDVTARLERNEFTIGLFTPLCSLMLRI